MADDNQNRGPGIAGNGFVWLLIAAAGTAFIHFQSPLESTRPTTIAPAPSQYHALQDVDARLWEDPFAPVVREEEKIVSRDAAARAELKAARQGRDTKELRADIAQEKVGIIIGVTLPGAPYPEETESRRRSRYAVAAALGAAGYQPNDGQHIGYFVRAGGTDQENEIVPFERFISEDKLALVLWLNEDAINASGRPLYALSELLCNLAPTGSAKVKIVGPGDGDTVYSMLLETHEPVPPDFCGHTPEFYAYGVTVNDSALLQDAIRDKYFVPKNLTNYFEDLPSNLIHDNAQITPRYIYYRTIVSDDRLADVLVNELHRRGIEALDQMAIVSEWDTFYGRTFPGAIVDRFNDKSHQNQRYSYLRGLDGQLPSAGSAGGAKAAKPRKSNQGDSEKDGTPGAGSTKPSEQADGESQFDYLRRIADRMKQQDAEHQRNGGNGIKAIGVLGSDVYDKLLVLRALRPEFPEAVFFTTDLDARLLDPSERQWTHNLLIASSFDLRLRDEVQEDIPPFRDCYETAVFLSTLLALSDPSDFGKYDVPAKWLKPLLFEVGRTRAHSLGTGEEPAEDEARQTSVFNYKSIQPVDPPVALSGWSFVSAVALLTIALSGFTLSFRWVRSGSSSRSIHPARTAIVVFCALMASLAIFTRWPSIVHVLTQGDLGEPMALFEEVSLWPTILLRCVAALLGVRLIIYTFYHLDSNIDDVAKDLQMERVRPEILKNHKWKLTEAFSFQLVPKVPTSPTGYDIDKFWTKYVTQGRTKSRVARVMFCVATMIAVGLIVAGIFDFPAVPARGLLSWWSYQIATILEVLTTLFLIFLVADATVFSCVFIRDLRNFSSVWPASTISFFSRNLQLDADCLGTWINVRFVAMRTKCIINLIYWPFLLVALLVISRSSLFAAFSTGPTLIIIQGITITILIGCVLWLRWAAERARDTARERLTDRLVAAQGVETPMDAKRAVQIEVLLNRVQTIREGAFSPISQQPLIRALLLPLGTYSGVALLQNMAFPGLQ